MKSSVFNKPAEVLLRIVPVELAGGGPVMQTIQIDEWLIMLSEKFNLPVRRIGVLSSSKGFVDEKITGKLHDLHRFVQPAESVSEIYHNVSSVLLEELHYLYMKGIRHITAVCCGYTSYGPFGLKLAMGRINADNSDDPITGNLIVQDSSFPDTDRLCMEVDEKGYPLTRFYGPAYSSTPDLKAVFTLNTAVPFDIDLSRRVPDSCKPLLSSFPFTQRYLKKWRKIGRGSKPEARTRLKGVIPGWELVKPYDWVIPILASDIWDPSCIDRWMTREQFDTVIDGTLSIVKALRIVSQKTDKPVFLPIVRSGMEFVMSRNLPDVYFADSRIAGRGSGVFFLPYNTLPQSSFADLIAGSDLLVNRAVQSNSFAETILAGKPQIVVTIPAAGYMEAELMAQGLKQGLLSYDCGYEKMGSEMYKILTDPKYKDDLISYFQAAFDGIYLNPKTNFGDIISRIAGLS